MDKKQPISGDRPIGLDQIGLLKAHKRLEIRQIRQRLEALQRRGDGGPLPDWSDLTLPQRFSIALRMLPLDLKESLLGKSGTQLRRYEAGAEIPFAVVAALATETQLPLQWLATGRAASDMDIWPSDEVAIQKLAFTASAGSGSLNVDDHAEHLPLARIVLDHVKVKPQNARVLEASGESMRETINDGDLLLVDIADRTIAEGKVYVFSVGDDIFVKRLRNAGGRVLIRADNQELFPGEEPVPSAIPFRVYGRVKWVGRSL